ncbi:MAG: outer membrane protein assembly factor BamC [Acidiferrobacterales bacterium]
MNHRRIAAGVAACALASILSACGTFSTPRHLYQNSFLRPPLEVPPGLMQPVTEDSLAIGSAAGSSGTSALDVQSVLPQFPGLRMVRGGCQRWVVAQATPEDLWVLVQRFAKSRKLTMVRESRAQGIMDTAWRAVEPYASAATATLPRVLGARAAYRFRLERGMHPGNTELYISRRTVYEVATSHGNVWEAAAPDPEAEARMLRAFMVFAGANPSSAAAPATLHASLQVDVQGNTVLSFRDSLDNGWRRTGLALERIGWLIKDRNRSQWTYRVQHAPAGGAKPGFFARLFGRHPVTRGPVYRVELRAGAAGWVELDLRTAGDAPVPPAVADPLLKNLYEQLK